MLPSRSSFSVRASRTLLPLTLLALAAGCSGEDADAGETGGSEAQGGASTGGSAGQSTGGSAGQSTGGSAGKAAGGSAGQAGVSGQAGASGQGGAGGKTACKVDSDCAALLPETKPAGCARAVCDPAESFCRLVARDLDGDEHGTATCASQKAGATIELGDDCDDGDKDVYPGAGSWDGPAGDGHPDRCDDGKDNDCSGSIDDDALDDGTTCKCTPGDVRKCAQDSAGKPITFPGGQPQGLCAFGNQTCSGQGKWGECTNAVGPAAEECNGKDDDCDGQTDETADVINPPTWTCDADGDNHAATAALKSFKQCNTPSEACGTAGVWTVSQLPVDDCDDTRSAVFTGAPEICDGIDNDCNPQTPVDTGTQFEFCLDADSDNYCDESAPAQLACAPAPGYRLKGNISGYEKTGCDKSFEVNPGRQEVCDGLDNDCDGSKDEGNPGSGAPCSTGKKGICEPGTTVCSNGALTCQQNSQPQAKELCDNNGIDEDCNGDPKNGCACLNGQTQGCSPPGKCGTGSQTCGSGQWGACTGGTDKACPPQWTSYGTYCVRKESLGNSKVWENDSYKKDDQMDDLWVPGQAYGGSVTYSFQAQRHDGGCYGKDGADGNPILVRGYCEGPGGIKMVYLRGDDFWKNKTFTVSNVSSCRFYKHIDSWTPTWQGECQLKVVDVTVDFGAADKGCNYQ